MFMAEQNQLKQASFIGCLTTLQQKTSFQPQFGPDTP